jgi:hypothetical protein
MSEKPVRVSAEERIQRTAARRYLEGETLKSVEMPAK